jgi:hypothetical protein
MPIKFLDQESKQYHTTKWEGVIYDDELIPSYERFFANFENSGNQDSKLIELVDLIDADFFHVTQTGLKEMAQWGQAFHMQHNIPEKKTAVLLPQEGESVVALFYKLWVAEFPEHVKIFRHRDKAIDWLTK